MVAHEESREVFVQCDICDYRTKSTGEMKVHTTNLHGPKQRLECERCHFVARSQLLLSHHCSYWCESCDLCCQSKIDFDLHMNLHEQCLAKSCNYKSSGIHYMNNHVKKAHFIGFKCDNCDDVFQEKKDLYVHERTHHITIKCFEKRSEDLRNEISCLKNEVNSALDKILGQFEKNMNRLEEKLTRNNEDLKSMVKGIALNQNERPQLNTLPKPQSQKSIAKSYSQAAKTTTKQTESNERKLEVLQCCRVTVLALSGI